MYTLTGSSLTFKRGAKPRSWKSLQREAKSLYDQICERGLAKNETILKAQVYRDLIKLPFEEIKQISPQYIHVINTAIRAYVTLGDKLRKVKTMFSMDLYVPVGELGLYPDLPEGLSSQAQSAGIKELRVLARES